MFHAKVVAHFMRDCGGNDCDDFAVIHRNATGKLKRAYWTFERFPNDAAFKRFTGQKLRVVIWMLFDEIFFAVIKETSERFVAVTWQVCQVLFIPNNNTQ